MKIMFFLDEFVSPHSGAESQLLKLIDGLKARNVTCEITVLRPTDYVDELKKVCPVHVLNCYKLLSAKSLWRIYKAGKLWRSKNFNTVHILLNDCSIFAPFLLKLSRLKVIVSRLDMGFWYSSKNLPLLRFSRRFVDKVLANGEAVRNIVCQNEGYSKSDCTIIYNGLLNTDASHIAPLNIKTKLGLSSQSKIVGIVASVYPIKRHQDLINAVSQLESNDVHIVAVGRGNEGQHDALISKLGMNNRVHFVGGQSNVLEWVKGFDIACLCSESEGFSNALLEYMMCGIPVLASDVGGNPELVKNGINGYLYPLGDCEQLSTRIQQILSNQGLQNKLRQGSLNSVDERFSFEIFVDRHTELYSSLL